MNWLQAIILGIIQGLTEFLPISSTAHLKVIPALLGWEQDPGAAFTAVIQWGTWVAAVIYYRHDIYRLTVGFVRGLLELRPLGNPDARLAWMIIVGTIPVVVFGLAFQKQIKNELRSLWVIAITAIGLAIILALAELLARARHARGHSGTDMENIGWWEALIVGFSQAVALIPGASRSGVTITGGLFAGMTRSSAARYSFLLSLPAIFGAGLYELYKERHELLQSHESIINLIIATVVSGIVGYAAIAFLIRFLRTHTTWVFIVYRIVLGVLMLVLLSQGILKEPAKEEPAKTTRASGEI